MMFTSYIEWNKFYTKVASGNLFMVIMSIGKNPSPTSARDKAKIEYISERQPSPYELAYGIELGPNPILRMSMQVYLNQGL